MSFNFENLIESINWPVQHAGGADPSAWTKSRLGFAGDWQSKCRSYGRLHGTVHMQPRIRLHSQQRRMGKYSSIEFVIYN